MVGASFGGYYYLQHKPGAEISTGQLLSAEVQVNRLAANAYGQLKANEMAPAGKGGGGNVAFGMGGDAASSAVSPEAGTNAKMIYPAPDYVQYVYSYKGDELNVNEQTMDVLRRVKGIGGNVNAAQILKQLNLGVVNPNSFSSTKLSSLTVNEDRDFGYSITVNMDEGSVYINENWQKWNTPDRACSTEACFQANRMQLSDMPANEEVITIADQFLKDHGIPTAAYGKPIVQDQWRLEYERVNDKSQAYIPDVVTVIYPLTIRGGIVYDEGGNPNGLMVTVNVRVKKVSNVGEITSNRFDASGYATETDVARLLKLAEQGGWRGGYGYPMPLAESGMPTPKTETIELGTPEVAYVKIWQYQNGQNNELLVPSLVFPITKKPTSGYFYQNSVIVPLIKEILDQQANDTPVRIMDPAVSTPAQTKASPAVESAIKN